MSSEPLESTLDAEDVPIWKCGDPLKYPPPLPKEDADYWSKLLIPLLKRDKEQCDVWKEEIQNSLIFAGLFSGVVTAFVTVSYQGLQPDSNQVIIALLSQIATTLDNTHNGTSGSVLPISLLDLNSTASPSSAISLVNVLWFASLVLSLTIALGGIVGLQWLREYQRYPPRSTSQETFAYFNMRSNGLKEWYVPQFFSALPILLLLALVLFLMGLSGFLLLDAPLQVSVPVIAVIGLPIAFIFLTTILHSYEWILPPVIFFDVRQRIPAQCPYKSPQSFLLKRILSPILSFLVTFLIRLLTPRNDANELDISWKSLLSTFPHETHRSDMIAIYYREICHEELYLKKMQEKPSKLSFRLSPIRLFLDEPELRIAVPPWYDLIEGLKNADTKGKRELSVQAACYQCIQELATRKQTVFEREEGRHLYIQSMLQKEWPSCEVHFSLGNFTVWEFPRIWSDIDRKALMEETRVSALRAFNWDVSARSVHGHELHIRLMHSYFRTMDKHGITLDDGTRKRLLYFWRNSSPVTNNQNISKQYTCLLRLLFTRSAVFTRGEVGKPLNFLPHPHLAQFVETACWNQAKDDVQLTIELIKNQISTYSSQELDPPDQDLLMYLMASYIVTLMDRSRRPSLRQEQGTAISVDLEGDRDLTSLRTLLGSITQ